MSHGVRPKKQPKMRESHAKCVRLGVSAVTLNGHHLPHLRNEGSWRATSKFREFLDSTLIRQCDTIYIHGVTEKLIFKINLTLVLYLHHGSGGFPRAAKDLLMVPGAWLVYVAEF